MCDSLINSPLKKKLSLVLGGHVRKNSSPVTDPANLATRCCRNEAAAAHLLRAIGSSVLAPGCSPAARYWQLSVRIRLLTIGCSVMPAEYQLLTAIGCAHIMGWLLPFVGYPLPAMSCPLLTACHLMLTVGCHIVRCSLSVRSFANVPSRWLFTRYWLHADKPCTSYLMFTLLSIQSNIRATDCRCNWCPLATIYTCAVVCWVDHWYPLCSLSYVLMLTIRAEHWHHYYPFCSPSAMFSIALHRAYNISTIDHCHPLTLSSHFCDHATLLALLTIQVISTLKHAYMIAIYHGHRGLGVILKFTMRPVGALHRLVIINEKWVPIRTVN